MAVNTSTQFRTAAISPRSYIDPQDYLQPGSVRGFSYDVLPERRFPDLQIHCKALWQVPPQYRMHILCETSADQSPLLPMSIPVDEAEDDACSIKYASPATTPLVTPQGSPHSYSLTPPGSPSPSLLTIDEPEEIQPVREAVRTAPKELFECNFGRCRCAKLNIFIPPDLTKHWLDHLETAGTFPNDIALYYYLNMSIAFQLNDEQINKFEINYEPVVLVHFDLTDAKGRMLYGVILSNDEHKKRNSTNNNDTGKWCWRLDELLTAQQIEDTYGIYGNELPLPSRRMHQFLLQLKRQPAKSIPASLVERTVWPNVKQVRVRAKGRRRRRSHRRRQQWQQAEDEEVELTKNVEGWIKDAMRGWNEHAAMPIVVNGAHEKVHWIEWVKFVRLPNDEYVGVSCRYDDCRDEWRVTSICMDRVDVENKHRLLMSTDYIDVEAYQKFFDCYNSQFAAIRWISSF